jgi:DNA-binding transcriptional MocR family regulator
MVTDLVQLVHGATAREIAASLEAAVRQGALEPGAALPSVRQLATSLHVSPPTVAAALADLRRRGVVVTHERRRSSVSPRPPVALGAGAPLLPPDVVDLARGNPDPALLPDLRPLLQHLAQMPRQRYGYGDAPVDQHLLELGRRELAEADVQPEDMALVSGALDGVERALAAHLAPGDRVVVEDPGYFAVFDLVRAMGLAPVPVAVDEYGLLPEALDMALATGARALVLTPRAHNPTGAALDAPRALALREVLRLHPHLLVVEDDHQGPIAGAAGFTLTTGRSRWAVVRSVAKSLGPDLRLAFFGGDAETVGRVEGRLALGPGWVSHLLQSLVIQLLESEEVRQQLQYAQGIYAGRRLALLRALADFGISATGRSGFNVWVHVADEASVASRLLHEGWAVATGARYRFASPPAIRITCATLAQADAPRLAAAIAQALQPIRRARIA